MDWAERQMPPLSWHRDAQLDLDPDPDLGAAPLTTIVRQSYLRHLANTVEDNYRTHFGVPAERTADLHSCILHLERGALRACMVSAVYRREMLCVINDIKRHTVEGKLYSDLRNIMMQVNTCAPGSVGPFLTPPADQQSPDDMSSKIDKITSVNNPCDEGVEENTSTDRTMRMETDSNEYLQNCEAAFSASEDTLPLVSECMTATDVDIDWDQIEEDMARVCGEIFHSEVGAKGDSLHENDQRKECFTQDALDQEQTLVNNSSYSCNSLPVSNRIEKPVKQHYWKDLRMKQEAELEFYLDNLRKSASIQKQAKLKRKYKELFGLDELISRRVFIGKEASRYRERIAPWVVQHLMPLYKKRRITSKVMFKKFAKHITDYLINSNCHPDECDVWMAVQEYFY